MLPCDPALRACICIGAFLLFGVLPSALIWVAGNRWLNDYLRDPPDIG